MKKFFQSKGFIVSSLALLCVSILGVCWFVSRDRTGDFRPDESPPSSVTGDWSDGGTQTDGEIKTDEPRTLDFSGVRGFLVTNVCIVQRSAA